ncbi:MAG: hypothetical protein IJV43_04095 [Oscillospiraceae bacterium]|nr:hypothetical protein [Oscillospiraceae bacterium]
MTDFIHEHSRDEQLADPTPPPEPEETPLDQKTGQKRVYGYIFILFIVAFSLLLWSFFMNQRSTDQVLSELRGSASTLQSTLDRNVALERQVEALEAESAALLSQIEELEERNKALENENSMLLETGNRLMYDSDVAMLEYAYTHEDYELCRGLIDSRLRYAYAEGMFSDGNPEPFTKTHFEEICRAAGMEQIVETP